MDDGSFEEFDPEEKTDAQLVVVDVYSPKGLLLQSTFLGDTSMRLLPPSDATYRFFVDPVKDMEGNKTDWAILEHDPHFGLPLTRLRTFVDPQKGLGEARRLSGEDFFDDQDN